MNILEFLTGGNLPLIAKSGIQIKKKNRGKLTDLKNRTGKTESELWSTGGPKVRKMITFARNSRKWEK